MTAAAGETCRRASSEQSLGQAQPERRAKQSVGGHIRIALVRVDQQRGLLVKQVVDTEHQRCTGRKLITHGDVMIDDVVYPVRGAGEHLTATFLDGADPLRFVAGSPGSGSPVHAVVALPLGDGAEIVLVEPARTREWLGPREGDELTLQDMAEQEAMADAATEAGMPVAQVKIEAASGLRCQVLQLGLHRDDAPAGVAIDA